MQLPEEFKKGISVLAEVKVKNVLPAPEACPYCGSAVEVRHHIDHYGQVYAKAWPWLYACTSCDASTGMHPRTSIPLGTMGDAATRAARAECKKPFIRLYTNGRMGRRSAYKRLAEKLGIDVNECHFGWFDIEMCHRAVEAVKEIEKDLESEDSFLRNIGV